MGTALEKPFSAYKGDEPFIFVCYAHSDAKSVYHDLSLLNNEGFNIWYDEGISAGKSWREEIAKAIKKADKLIFFISEASLVSKHCLREIDYALDHDIDILPIYLDDTRLPEELALALNRVQALYKAKDTNYSEHLISALHANVSLLKSLRKSRKSPFRKLLSATMIAAVLVAVFVWYQNNLSTHNIDTSVSSTSTAHNNYMNAVKLLNRWDKDDNVDLAINLLQEAYTLDPNFALAYAREAEALRIRYILSGDDVALEKAANSATKAVSLNANLAPVQAALGLVYSAKGNLDLAIAALERGIAIDPNDAMTNKAIATIYVQLGRTDDANKAFQKAIALDPDNPSVMDSYANFLYEQGRFNEAISQWQTLLTLAPDHYVAMLNMGVALEQTMQLTEAIEMYQKAISIRPNYMVYNNLGTAYSKQRRFQEAADTYLKAIELDSSDSLAWGNLGFVYSWIGNMDEDANKAFNKAIELAENIRQQYQRDPLIHADLALYYAKTNQANLALQRLRTASVLAPNSAPILVAAAETYEILGQRDNAIQHILKAFEHGYTKKQLSLSPVLENLANDPSL